MRPKSKYALEELLAGITPENRHDEIDFGPPVGREFGGPFEGVPYTVTRGGQTMPARVRKVEGGYELFIPDEVAARTGISAEAELEVSEMADMLMVRQEQFVQAKRAAEWAKFDPSQLPDPNEPYDVQPGVERPGR